VAKKSFRVFPHETSPHNAGDVMDSTTLLAPVLVESGGCLTGALACYRPVLGIALAGKGA
jgi:hypothetical protein